MCSASISPRSWVLVSLRCTVMKVVSSKQYTARLAPAGDSNWSPARTTRGSPSPATAASPARTSIAWACRWIFPIVREPLGSVKTRRYRPGR